MRLAMMGRLRGLGEQQVAPDLYFGLKSQAAESVAKLDHWQSKLLDVRRMPFLSRENVARVAAMGVSVQELRGRLAAVQFTERSRDLLYVSTSQADVQSLIDSAASRASKAESLVKDAQREVIRRAALAGFFTLAAVGGGLWFYSKKR